jgi:hypothetical protein
MIGFTLQQLFQQGDSVLDPAILQVPADVEHLSARIPQWNPTDLELPLAVGEGEASVVALIGLITKILNGINGNCARSTSFSEKDVDMAGRRSSGPGEAGSGNVIVARVVECLYGIGHLLLPRQPD